MIRLLSRRSITIDTYQTLLQLEKNGFNREQSIELMNALDTLTTKRLALIESKLASKEDTDEFLYQTRLILQQTKTELSSLRKTEAASLQSRSGMIQRELDLLSMKFREDYNQLKSDLQLDMNIRKAEMKEERQKNEMGVQELNHSLSLAVGDLKTEIEVMKLELLTQWASGIVLGVSAVTVILIKLL